MTTRFDIRCALDYEVLATAEFVFNVEVAATRQQRIAHESLTWEGASSAIAYTDPAHGNRFLKLGAEAGRLSLRYEADVSLAHHVALPYDLAEVPVRELPPEVMPYLLPSRYCESDRLFNFAVQKFGAAAPGYARVEAVCDWVHRHVRFMPGASHCGTTALHTLEGGAGVCRDFAHLTIALLRALNVPARFVAGYDYGADPALGPTDFHAYVEAFVGGRWYIFDSSRLCPRNGLVRIGTGYDAADVPFATIFGPVRYLGMRLDITPLDAAGGPVEIRDDRSLALSTASVADMLPFPRRAARAAEPVAGE